MREICSALADYKTWLSSPPRSSSSSSFFKKWKLKLQRWKFVFENMEAEVVKMEVYFLKKRS